MSLSPTHARHQIARLLFRCAADPVEYSAPEFRALSKRWVLALRRAYKAAFVDGAGLVVLLEEVQQAGEAFQHHLEARDYADAEILARVLATFATLGRFLGPDHI